MIHGKKALSVLGLIFFVIMLVLLIGFFMNLWGTTSRAATSFLDKEIKKYELEAGSYIHPDLPLAQKNFWNNEFLNFIEATINTKEIGGDFCYGTFYTDPGFKELEKWGLTFFQEKEGNIKIQLEDSAGTVGAFTDIERQPFLKDKQLCIRMPRGREIDVEQITIKFGKEKSYYYENLQTGTKTDFYYQPYLHPLNNGEIRKNIFIFDWLKKDDVDSNLYFYAYSKESKKLCIMPMEKNGMRNSFSHRTIASFLSQRETGYPRYPAFCDIPENVISGIIDKKNRKTCFYTPCAEFDSRKISSEGLPKELERVKSIENTTCGRFSKQCGGICTPSKGITLDPASEGIYFRNLNFECEPCIKYEFCSDFKDKSVCEAARRLCNKNCKWDSQDNQCISG